MVVPDPRNGTELHRGAVGPVVLGGHYRIPSAEPEERGDPGDPGHQPAPLTPRERAEGAVAVDLQRQPREVNKEALESVPSHPDRE